MINQSISQALNFLQKSTVSTCPTVGSGGPSPNALWANLHQWLKPRVPVPEPKLDFSLDLLPDVRLKTTAFPLINGASDLPRAIHELGVASRLSHLMG